MDNLKKFAVRLSKEIQKVIGSTTYIKLPLRGADLSQNHSISKLVKDHGFHSFYQCLHLIVENKLEDLVKGLSYKKVTIGGKERVDWYFDRSVAAKSKNPILTFTRRLEINLTDEIPPLYFSPAEILILKKYKNHFENLVNGDVEPKTELQQRFKQVALSLLERRTEKLVPKYYHEKMIAKYLLAKYYFKSNQMLSKPNVRTRFDT